MAASDAAREAVLRPVEGTILTVARAGGGEAQTMPPDAGRGPRGRARHRTGRRAADALARTPEQLPVLAQAGVVDAGGTGFVLLLDAALTVADGRPLPEAPAERPGARPVVADALPHGRRGRAQRRRPTFGTRSCTSSRRPTRRSPAFKEVWAGLGDSIVVVGGDGLWNCHIHTDDVGASIEAALDVGRPRDIRVTDLVEQIEEERWVREGRRCRGRRRRSPALRPAPPWWRWPTARASAGSSAPSGCTTSWPVASR